MRLCTGKTVKHREEMTPRRGLPFPSATLNSLVCIYVWGAVAESACAALPVPPLSGRFFVPCPCVQAPGGAADGPPAGLRGGCLLAATERAACPRCWQNLRGHYLGSHLRKLRLHRWWRAHHGELHRGGCALVALTAVAQGKPGHFVGARRGIRPPQSAERCQPLG